MADPPSTHDLPSSSDAATMTDSHIPHLPNEILCEIASYVADDDVLNLRLSVKIFHAITADRFAMTFFENRAYDLSPEGLVALVEITEHPSFARHIKTVIIGHGTKVSTSKHYHHLLEQAFQNLARIGNTISLGLRQVHKCRNARKHSMNLRYTIKFFEQKVLGAAMRARMSLGHLVADVQSAPRARMFPSVADKWTQSYPYMRLVSGYNHSKDLKIQFDSPESCSSSTGHVLYDDRNVRLEVLRVGTWQWRKYLSYRFHTVLREVVLEDCYVEYHYLMGILETSGQSLTRLSMCNFRLKVDSVGDTWMSLFAAPTISLAMLKSCRLGKLWDESNGCWLEGGDKTIDVSTRAQASTVLSNLAAGIRTFTLDD